MIELTNNTYKIVKDKYQIDNVGLYPRVSAILDMAGMGKDILDKWKKKVILNRINKCRQENKGKIDLDTIGNCFEEPNDILIASAVFGNKIHDYIEDFLNTNSKTDLTKLSIREATTLKSFYKFYEEWNISDLRTLSCEQLIWSNKHKYAGCIDWLAIDGKDNVFLFDWKTSNAFRIKYYLQIAAYWKAFEEIYNRKIVQASVIVFNKESVKYDYRIINDKEVEYYFNIFKGLLNLYEFKDIE